MAELLDRLKSALAGRYDVEREIGRGGSATVFLARDLKHPRRVAIKVLKPEIAAVVGPERFLKEIELTSSFTNLHILPLLDSGITNDLLYYVMPYVQGESLRDRLHREKQLPINDAVSITRDAARALEYAHERGVLHRDIKPENILLEAGEAVVADFGIARAIEGGEGLTATGVAIGTPAYMSPEQASGEVQLDGRSDLYSLGCVLYEMLASRPPFAGGTAESIINQHRTAEIPKIASVRPTTPRGIELILSRLLAKAPADRYATAHDLAHALGMESRPPDTSERVTTKRHGLVPLGIATIVLAGVLGLVGINFGGLRDRLLGGTAQAEIGSLAVLPLQDLSNEPKQEYFADGMTEVLTAELGKIHSLKVISRTSAMRYKETDKSIPEIGRELNVDAVVEGSVLRAEGRVRITAQLIHTSTDRHLWAENYERDLRDVMSLQGEVARDIAKEVQATLTPSEEAELVVARPVDPEALDAYLKGMAAFDGTRRGVDHARDYFQQALEFDSTYSLAHLGLGICHAAEVAWNVVPTKVGLPLAKAAVQTALRYDDMLADAHSRLGYLHLGEWEWDAAEKELSRALELNPNSARAQRNYSLYLSLMGQHDEAIARALRAQELSPLSQSGRTSLGSRYLYARHYDEAIEHFRTAIEAGYVNGHYWMGEAYMAKGMYAEAVKEFKESLRLDPSTEATAVLGWGYATAGMIEEANSILKEILERSKQEYVSPQSIACIYTGLGEIDKAFEWLERAYEEQNFYLCTLKVAPVYDPLRSDPRLEDLMRRVGLADVD